MPVNHIVFNFPVVKASCLVCEVSGPFEKVHRDVHYMNVCMDVCILFLPGQDFPQLGFQWTLGKAV